MKFETLTYAAGATDFSVGDASAPQILGRSDPSQAGVSPIGLSDVAAKLWVWMSVQICACLSAMMAGAPQARLVLKYAQEDDISGPLFTVRLNRSIRRKLRRLERRQRGPKAQRGFAMGFCEPDDNQLSPTQYMERRIRTERIGRTRLYGLNFSMADLGRRAVTGQELQGDRLCLRRAALCCAPLSPD